MKKENYILHIIGKSQNLEYVFVIEPDYARLRKTQRIKIHSP